ncbi:cobalamin biosynthesis protein [Xanthomonas medicagonis]|uniref:cobalamin biosynthesis protein n=1 Tax=Xanthomonas medicagonis TaxID=3160841 RepID=UPI003511452B
MFTTLVAVIVALVLGHVAPGMVASLRRFDAYGDWLSWLDAHAGEGSAWRGRYGIALALLPALLLVALLQWLLAAPHLGLLALLFGVLVLAFSWGPRDLDSDVEAVIEADDLAARRLAIAHLQADGVQLREDPAGLVEAVAFSALRRWFAPLFWFLLLGPFGALGYRLLALAAVGPYAPRLPLGTAAGARVALAAMEWPVAQLMTFSLALVGNFESVFGAWRAAGGNRWRLDGGFLGPVACASVRGELDAEAHDYSDAGMLVPALRSLPELRDAMSQIWRVLLLWLVVLALLVIAGWVS